MKNNPTYHTDEILNSLEGMQRPAVPDEIRGRLLQKIHVNGEEKTYIGGRKLWLVAASVAVLVMGNVYALKVNTRATPDAKSSLQNLLQEYGIENSTQSVYFY